jgi:hypothetical protein
MKNEKEYMAFLKIQHWNLFCISEALREYKIDYQGSVSELYELIPFGYVRKSIELGNATPVCDWVITHLGFYFDNDLDKWVSRNE